MDTNRTVHRLRLYLRASVFHVSLLELQRLLSLFTDLDQQILDMSTTFEPSTYSDHQKDASVS